MLEPEVARQVVFSNSQPILDEVLDCADAFRRALGEDRRSRQIFNLGQCEVESGSKEFQLPRISRHSRSSTTSFQGSVTSAGEVSLPSATFSISATDKDLASPKTPRRLSANLTGWTSVTSRSGLSTTRSSLTSEGGRGDVPSNLDVVLKHYLEELARKKFSAASTDAILLESGQSGGDLSDREIIGHIMEQFVEHLDQNWCQEWKAQRERQAALGSMLQAATGYLLRWASMSPVQFEKIRRAALSDPGRELAIMLLSPIPALIFLLLPFADASLGWQHQALFWAFFPFGNLTIALGQLSFLCSVAGLPPAAIIHKRLLGWLMANCIWIFTVVLATSITLDQFPIPHPHAIAAASSCMTLPFLVLCLKPAWRQNWALLKRLSLGLLCLCTLTSVFFMGFSTLTAFMQEKKTVWAQCIMIAVFLSSKFAFERFGGIVSTVLGADFVPVFVFQASLGFEMQVCVCLGSGFDALPFVLLLAVDTLENGYYLWSLAREQASESKSIASSLRQHFIISTLLVREYVEIATPILFLAFAELIRYFNPTQSALLCSLDDEGFAKMRLFILADIILELVIFSVTCIVLRCYSFRPLLMLRGVVHVYFYPFLAVSAAFLLVCWSNQHTHFVGAVC